MSSIFICSLGYSSSYYRKFLTKWELMKCGFFNMMLTWRVNLLKVCPAEDKLVSVDRGDVEIQIKLYHRNACL